MKGGVLGQMLGHFSWSPGGCIGEIGLSERKLSGHACVLAGGPSWGKKGLGGVVSSEELGGGKGLMLL